MSSLDDQVSWIFQGMSAYLRFFIFLQVEGMFSQFVIECKGAFNNIFNLPL